MTEGMSEGTTEEAAEKAPEENHVNGKIEENDSKVLMYEKDVILQKVGFSSTPLYVIYFLQTSGLRKSEDLLIWQLKYKKYNFLYNLFKICVDSKFFACF